MSNRTGADNTTSRKPGCNGLRRKRWRHRTGLTGTASGHHVLLRKYPRLESVVMRKDKMAKTNDAQREAEKRDGRVRGRDPTDEFLNGSAASAESAPGVAA